jgi:Skp family chaperone for outer membrane proteins
MSRSIQTLTLGVALGAAVVAGVSLTNSANATRVHSAADSDIAFVDVFAIVDLIVLAPDQTAARVAIESEGQQRLQDLQARNAEIQRTVQTNAQDDPSNQRLIGEFQENQQQMQTVFQDLQTRLQLIVAGQVADAYGRVYEAVGVVAAERGINFVFATRPNADLIQVETITGVAQEILARPLVTPASAVDLTDAVRESLGLERAPADDASILDGAMPIPGAERTTEDDASPDQTTDQPGDQPGDQPSDQPSGD